MNRIEIGWTYPCWCMYVTLFGSTNNALPDDGVTAPKHVRAVLMYEGRLISNAHSEISRKRDNVFKQTKVGSKVQYFSYKLTYLFFDIVALSCNTFFPNVKQV
jgi:hypothetical protein